MSLLKQFKSLLKMWGVIPHAFYGSPPAAPSNTTSNVTSNSTPWGPAGEALQNQAYPAVQNYVNSYGNLNGAQQATIANQQNNLQNQNNSLSSLTNNALSFDNAMGAGAGNTHYNPVANAATSTSNAAQSDYGTAINQSGTATANQQLLSGQVNMPVENAMNQANIQAANRQYDLNITNLAQNTLPQINNDAFAAGQYGGSRQGIAQGLAINGLTNANTTLAQSNLAAGNNLYGNAYNTAQGLMGSTANNLVNQSVNNNQYNAGNIQANNQFNANALNSQSQFNANLGITNNNQQLAQNAQNIATQQNGYNQGQAALNNQLTDSNANYNAQMLALQQPQIQAQNALNMQLGAYGAGANIGGSSSQNSVQPIYNNTMGQAAGLLTSGAGLVSAFK